MLTADEVRANWRKRYPHGRTIEEIRDETNQALAKLELAKIEPTMSADDLMAMTRER